MDFCELQLEITPDLFFPDPDPRSGIMTICVGRIIDCAGNLTDTPSCCVDIPIICDAPEAGLEFPDEGDLPCVDTEPE